MALEIDEFERLARARSDLRMGVPVVIGGAGRALLVAAAETISDARLADLRRFGQPFLAVTVRRAETLKARAYDGDLARVTVPDECNADWLRSVADPAQDLAAPMKGPLVTARGGDAAPWRAAIRLAKRAHLLPAVVGVELDPATADLPAELTFLAPDIAAMQVRDRLQRVVGAHVPIQAAGDTRLFVFRPADGSEEHYAVIVGRPDLTGPVLTRLHSACFTGDLLGSLKCDCGAQLRGALHAMADAGAGILLYLNQEGRGIGLANKMRAYSLQDQGFDTVEANHRLGFEDDERDFRIGAAILRDLRVASVRLLTNNPAKVDMLRANGIDVVERVPLQVGRTAENADYLATKARKSGHIL